MRFQPLRPPFVGRALTISALSIALLKPPDSQRRSQLRVRMSLDLSRAFPRRLGRHCEIRDSVSSTLRRHFEGR